MTAVAFGGPAQPSTNTGAWTYEIRHDLSWYSPNNTHRFRLTIGALHEQSRETRTDNPNGHVVYSSLGDLADLRPTSYWRQLAAEISSDRADRLGVAIGDQWRQSGRLLIQYGMRFDQDLISSTAAGPHSDAVRAQRSFVSPRAGFVWNYGTDHHLGRGARPAGTVRGGMGLFRAQADPVFLHGAARTRAGSIGRVTCYGSTVPFIDWSSMAAGPGAPPQCSDGQSTSPTTADDSVTVSRAYQPPVSRRASLGWDGAVLGRFSLNIDATASTTHWIAQRDYTDLPPEAQFSLNGENSRPVFVVPSSISADGVVGLPSRRQAELNAGGAAKALQFTVSLGPKVLGPGDRVIWGAAYAVTSARLRRSGFAGTTAGDPRVAAWEPSPYAPKHRVTAFFGIRNAAGAFASVGGQFQSGLPYTPVIGGDINGDGLINDRAFIPVGVSSSACVRSQAGMVARPGSCTGPSLFSMSASSTVPGSLLHLTPDARISFSVSNLLGGLDVALHGRNPRGWGQLAMPDPVFAYAVGFDPSRNQFSYRSNTNFGKRESRSIATNPFRVTLDIRLPLSAPRAKQLLDRVLAPGRTRPGPRLTEDEILSRYKAFAVVNPIEDLRSIADSLQLTREQKSSLDTIASELDAVLDATWRPVARAIAAADGDEQEKLKPLIAAAQDEAWDALAADVGRARDLLTADQLGRLDSGLNALLDPAAIARLRKADFRF